MTLLLGKNIVFGHGDHTLVEPFDFSIAPGTVVGLLGLNGSGKTTFFKTLMGAIPLMDGTLNFRGKDLAQFSYAERQPVFAWLPARKALEERLLVFEVLTFSSPNLLIGTAVQQVKVLQQMDDVIALLHLEEFLQKPYHHLSEGQKKKVEVAALLMKNAEILLLDEPSVFLDIENQSELVRIVKSLSRDQNKCIFVSSHNLSFIQACANQCWEIEKNKMVISENTAVAVARYADKLSR